MGYDALGNFDGNTDTGTFANPSSFKNLDSQAPAAPQPPLTFASRRNTSLSQSNTGKYTVDMYNYPSNVSNSPDTQHYIGFYINIPESSQFNKDNRIGFLSAEGANRIDAANSASAKVTAKVAEGLAGAGIGAAGGAFLGKMVGLSKGATQILSAGAAVVGGAVVASSGVFTPEKTQRLDTVVMLATQNAPSAKYSASWESGELGQIGGMLAGGASAADATRSMSTVASDITRALASQVGKLGNLVNSQQQVQNYLELTTQRVTNPQREQLFKSIGFRTFSFSYKFMPASEEESGNVFSIIQLFKFHMHPELSGGGLFYVYPSTFDIVYYYKGNENEYINKIATCALTDVQVTYGGQEWATFDDGAPVEINLTLSFIELETLTKDRIAEGY